MKYEDYFDFNKEGKIVSINDMSHEELKEAYLKFAHKYDILEALNAEVSYFMEHYLERDETEELDIDPDHLTITWGDSIIWPKKAAVADIKFSDSSGKVLETRCYTKAFESNYREEK